MGPLKLLARGGLVLVRRDDGIMGTAGDNANPLGWFKGQRAGFGTARHKKNPGADSQQRRATFFPIGGGPEAKALLCPKNSGPKMIGAVSSGVGGFRFCTVGPKILAGPLRSRRSRALAKAPKAGQPLEEERGYRGPGGNPDRLGGPKPVLCEGVRKTKKKRNRPPLFFNFFVFFFFFCFFQTQEQYQASNSTPRRGRGRFGQAVRRNVRVEQSGPHAPAIRLSYF